MASNLRPVLAYIVIYVKDVAKSVTFYEKAFGFSVRRLDKSHRWGELESGQSTIAFTPLHQHETDEVTGSVQTAAGSHGERQPVEVCFAFSDVDAAYKSQHGRWDLMSEPEEKEWGQKVGYVRDINGIVVRMGSHVQSPKHD
ncbi:hypothetical protein F8388_005617 [Cannabis sativa]|uniref:VOC domain-containing protein n=1 Tax=Cannabis sativa TaxID=3483 RepID=A0A7J6EJQ1_CANSA|nr:hypothetical protein F8388_005617 [Cannabis sativa]